MGDLQVARGFSLPLEYITKSAAILAKKRIGKTYNASVIAEEFVRVGLPFVVLDPTSAWWGMRASANGLSDGLPVTIIGGEHGDLPLDVGSGRLIADLVVENPGFYIIDLGHWENDSEHRRWAAPFLDRLYRRKAKIRDPLHLFIDEADVFAPQKPQRGDEAMLHNMQAIVRRGGIRGLGTTLITQRAAVLNKDVLTQLDLLIILRTISPQDQNAVEDYIKRGAASQRAEIMGSLASLPPGRAWIYGPGEDPPIVEQVQFRERKTFNSSATPDGQDSIEPKKMATVDLEGLRDHLAASIAKADAEDPKKLKAALDKAKLEIEKLTKDLEDRPAETKTVEVPAFTEGELESLRTALDEWNETVVSLKEFSEGFQKIMHEAITGLVGQAAELGSTVDIVQEIIGATPRPVEELTPAQRDRLGQVVASTPMPHPGPAPGGLLHVDRDLPRPRASAAVVADGPLPKAAVEMVQMLIRFPNGLSRERLALLCGKKPRGGSWNTALKSMFDGNYVVENGTLQATTRAADEYGEGLRVLDAEGLWIMWRAKLSAPAVDMMTALQSQGAMTRDELGNFTGRAPRGGSWNTALKELRTAGLISESGDRLQPVDFESLLH